MSSFNPVPESLAKQKKRADAWETERAAEAKASASAAKNKQQDIYKRAEKHLAEYKAQVHKFVWKKRINGVCIARGKGGYWEKFGE